jgi:hypothetical protein
MDSNKCIDHDDAHDDLLHALPTDHVEHDVKESSTTAHAVVKMKLNSFCCNTSLVKKINKVILDANILLGEAYAFANFHIRRLLDDNVNGRVALSLLVQSDNEVTVCIKPVITSPIPSVDRSFFYRCLLAVASSNARAGTLGNDFATSILMFDRLRPLDQQKIDTKELNQLVADLSIIMATMASNHLWTNLHRRLHKYVKSKYPSLKGKWKDIVKGVITQPKATVNSVIPDNMPNNRDKKTKKTVTTVVSPKVEMARNAISELRTILPLTSAAKHASKAHLTLPLYFHILQHDEAMSLAKRTTSKSSHSRPHLFTLLPAKGGFTISNIPISSMLLLKLLKSLGLEKFPGDGRALNAMVYWRKYFNLNVVETRNRHFGERIVTDGCAVSVLLNKRCRLVTGSSTLSLPTQADFYGTYLLTRPVRIVGVDPGYHEVVTCRTREDGKEASHSKSYSSARYYEVAKFNLSRRRTSKWNAETMALTTAVPASMSANAVAMDHYIAAYLKVLRPLTQHRHQKGYRNMRFLRYVHKRRAIEEICDLIAPPDGTLTLVGFGNWKAGNGSPVSRRTSGPIEEIKLALSGRKNVMLTILDEYRTSVTCSCCGEQLVNMQAKAMDRKTKLMRDKPSSIHRTLHCKSRSCRHMPGYHGTTWNRDVNASRNLLKVMHCFVDNQERPIELQRNQSKSKSTRKCCD